MGFMPCLFWWPLTRLWSYGSGITILKMVWPGSLAHSITP
jgi:hypothetical protein